MREGGDDEKGTQVMGSGSDGSGVLSTEGLVIREDSSEEVDDNSWVSTETPCAAHAVM